ncbi:helix-turn-helix domain-containing protein, partial [Bacteroides stercoris]|uniref:helix-turn-helix domain-containing protein n=1 Tax=Bacteroides stercoris TaxID=46506 RepID=UPI0022DF63DA
AQFSTGILAHFSISIYKRTLLDYRRYGILPYYQIGGKILYRESDIVRLLEKNRKEAF